MHGSRCPRNSSNCQKKENTGSGANRGRRSPPFPNHGHLELTLETPTPTNRPRSRSGTAGAPEPTEWSDYEADPTPSPHSSREARAGCFRRRNGAGRVRESGKGTVAPVPVGFVRERAVSAFASQSDERWQYRMMWTASYFSGSIRIHLWS